MIRWVQSTPLLLDPPFLPPETIYTAVLSRLARTYFDGARRDRSAQTRRATSGTACALRRLPILSTPPPIHIALALGHSHGAQGCRLCSLSRIRMRVRARRGSAHCRPIGPHAALRHALKGAQFPVLVPQPRPSTLRPHRSPPRLAATAPCSRLSVLQCAARSTALPAHVTALLPEPDDPAPGGRKSSQVESSQVESSQVESSQVKSSRVK